MPPWDLSKTPEAQVSALARQDPKRSPSDFKTRPAWRASRAVQQLLARPRWSSRRSSSDVSCVIGRGLSTRPWALPAHPPRIGHAQQLRENVADPDPLSSLSQRLGRMAHPLSDGQHLLVDPAATTRMVTTALHTNTQAVAANLQHSASPWVPPGSPAICWPAGAWARRPITTPATQPPETGPSATPMASGRRRSRNAASTLP